MPEYWILPIYTFLLALTVILVVPKEKLRKLIKYAIFYGAIIDMTLIVVLTNLLHIGGYKNFQPFGALGVPFFPPIAWVAYFTLFLYLLPQNKPWKYIYIVAAAGYSVLFSNVLANLNVFKWNYGNVMVPFIIYFLWFLLVSFTYQRYFRYMDL